ncbi:MAG: hypothetical protein RQ866_03600, partial [Bacteroidales bacterium]|nr:hypothetical protein [Bacteroidales bacterium]
EKLFDNHDKASNILSGNIPLQNGSNDHDEHTLTNLTKESPKFFQFQKKYIITGIKSGLVIIDQMLAHQRILYERFIREIGDKSSASQKLLFPITVNIAPNDIPIMEEITTQLEALGFQWDVTQHGEIEISGKPAIITDTAITTLFESIIEAWKNGTEGGHDEAQTRIAKQMAQKLAVPHGMILEESEMSLLIDQLFSCAYSEYAPNGEKIFTIIGFDVLHEMFLNDHNKNKE